MRYTILALTTIAIILLSTIPAAQSITLDVKDAITGNFLNTTVDVTYNQYSSYQETATSTLSTVQKNTGTYAINNLTNTSFYFYVNYTKPDSAIGALWEVFRGYTPATRTIRNYSLSACYNASSTLIQLRASAYYSGNQTEECYDGTTWVVLNTAAKNGSAFPPNRPSNNVLDTYDADNTTGSCFTTVFSDPGYGGWGWTNSFLAGGGGNNCVLREEKIHWNITRPIPIIQPTPTGETSRTSSGSGTTRTSRVWVWIPPVIIKGEKICYTAYYRININHNNGLVSTNNFRDTTMTGCVLGGEHPINLVRE